MDGFIARPDGKLDDFSADGEHFADLLAAFPETIPGHLREPLGVTGANREFDTVLMGRATYSVGTELGFTNPYPHLEQLVISSSMQSSPDAAVQLVSEHPVQAVRELKARVGKSIWLCGGSRLASTLFDEIDELILKMNPFLMGKGIPLFANGVSKTDLVPVDRQVYDNGFMLLRFQLRHAG